MFPYGQRNEKRIFSRLFFRKISYEKSREMSLFLPLTVMKKFKKLSTLFSKKVYKKLDKPIHIVVTCIRMKKDTPIKKAEKKTPNAGAIKPGEVRNPHGRPKTGTALADFIRGILEANNNEKRSLIIDRAVSRAIDEKTPEADAEKWARFLFDRAYGKPIESIEMSGKDGGPIQVFYVDKFKGV